jgi:hypothetical protein
MAVGNRYPPSTAGGRAESIVASQHIRVSKRFKRFSQLSPLVCGYRPPIKPRATESTRKMRAHGIFIAHKLMHALGGYRFADHGPKAG